MTGVAFGIFFAIFGLIIAGIAIAFARQQAAATNEAWKSAADLLHFSFEPGGLSSGPKISGTITDHAAVVESYTKKSGNNSTRYTRYTVEFPSLGVGLGLSQQTGFGGFLKVLGAQDVEVGDPVFDDAFIVKAKDPDGARRLLTQGRRLALNRLLAVHPEIAVLDYAIVLDKRGAVRDTDVLVSAVRRLASVAATLAEAQPAEELTAMVEARLGGDIPDYEPDTTATIDERLTAGEALMVSGLAEAAMKIFDSLAIEIPADVEVKGWSRQAERQPAPPSQPPVESAVPEPPPPPLPTPESTEVSVAYAAESGVANVDPIGVATYLFGENRLSFETAALFDEKHAGKRVEWPGKVRTSSRVESDRVLGDGPFLKAVIEVASLENDLFGNTVVSAVVAFSPEQVLSPGSEITFTGELTAIDALVRNLYVANGRLT
ncbi:MAG: hypothetical protein ABFS21_08030 [Actinomycetota bacterium]